MDAFECRRCGAAFSREAHLIRHLERKQACPTTKSILDRQFLIAEQRQSSRKQYACGYCDKSFSQQCSIYRHRRGCTKFQANRAAEAARERAREEAVVEVVSLRREMANISERVVQLEKGRTVVPAQNIVTGGIMAVGNNNNNNQMNIYPIVPWDPEHTDFTPLRENVHLRAHEQAFISKTPVETLMFLHMGMKPPRHHFLYLPSDDPDSARFFDGASYKRAEDPRGEFRKGYSVYHRELVSFMTECEEDLRRGCRFADADFDTKKENLLSAADKIDCVEAIAKSLSRHADDVQSQAIARHNITVE